ncbi:hypothetical protein FRB96_008520 [Tulasnella sp. 330]|nr:hypothetical protein FRB96_008520 [Tulasnella sp. 330]KAG8871078.1 hypothetical protein FRB97_009102 [Tulasnella sp. 331]KAG8873350.1 hypothetical protein FRB98_009065 [Tulasnella sp. 332]
MPFTPVRRSTSSSVVIRYHSSASDFLANCQSDLKTRERDANIIYPFALKAKHAESSSSSTSSPTTTTSHPRFCPSITTSFTSDSETSDDETSAPAPASPSKNDQFWLSAWTVHGRQPAKLDMVLSCTNGPINKYPIFLYSNVPDEDLATSFVQPRIDALVSKLRSCVKSKRVFSVYGPVPLAQSFVRAWSSLTGAVPVVEPYYAAKHTFCTRETLSSSIEDSAPLSPLSPSHDLRLAEPKDLASAAALCYGFASGSEPFVLSVQDSFKEAGLYIQNRQMYAYKVGEETASIVCVTRSSQNVAAITKVYTNPQFRGRKCAEKLVRHACQHQLGEMGKREVVLFVAHDNKAAEKVYDRVGFQGLWGKARPEGVNDWVEIGFEDAEVGHW